MSLPSSMADFVPCDRLLQKAYFLNLQLKPYRLKAIFVGNISLHTYLQLPKLIQIVPPAPATVLPFGTIFVSLGDSRIWTSTVYIHVHCNNYKFTMCCFSTFWVSVADYKVKHLRSKTQQDQPYAQQINRKFIDNHLVGALGIDLLEFLFDILYNIVKASKPWNSPRI